MHSHNTNNCREKEENQLEQLRLQLEAERRRKAQVEESLNTVRAVSRMLDFVVRQCEFVV